MPRMSIHFQLTAMAPRGSCKGMGKATARATMPTLVINQHLVLDRDCIKGFISEQIRGLIQISNVCSIKDDKAWDLFYDIIFLDPVTTRHFSQFQLMWPHHRSRSSPFREWWAAFRSYMGQMFDKTRNEMNNWRWDNPRTIVDHVDGSNPETTGSRKVQRTGDSFSSYRSDDHSAKFGPPSCGQFKLGDFLAVKPLNWDEIIHKADDDENWADPGAPSSEKSRPSDGNDNDNGEGEEDTQGGEKGTGKDKGPNDGMGKGKGKAKGNGKAMEEGKGKGNGKWIDIVEQT